MADRPVAPLVAQLARIRAEPHECARAVPDLKQPESSQELNGLPDRAATHLELLAELAFARQPVAGVQNALFDQARELLDHALLEGEWADRLESEPLPAGCRRRAHAALTAGPASAAPSRSRMARAARMSITTRAPIRAVFPEGSRKGATSTQSQAMIGPEATISRPRTSSRPVMPPISGPQVPHAKPPSSTSMSTERYTPAVRSVAAASACRATSSMPMRSMSRTVNTEIPCSSATSFSSFGFAAPCAPMIAMFRPSTF